MVTVPFLMSISMLLMNPLYICFCSCIISLLAKWIKSKINQISDQPVSLTTQKKRERHENIKLLDLIIIFIVVPCIYKVFNSSNYIRESLLIIKYHKPFFAIEGFYSFQSLTCENEITETGRSYVNVSLNINDCFFKRVLMLSGHGGIICINGGSHSMAVESSMFFECKASKNGGSIFFFSKNMKLSRICANNCTASGDHFIYSNAKIQNSFEYVSITSCSYLTQGYSSFRINQGMQNIDHLNSSLNYVIESSGFLCDSPSSFLCEYCTISNNRVSNAVCIDLSYNSGKIINANILANNSPAFGVIRIYGDSPKLEYCIIIDNRNTLFFVVSGSISISHCFVSHSTKFFSSGSVTTNKNNSFFVAETHRLIHYYSYYCNTDHPSQSESNHATSTAARTYDYRCSLHKGSGIYIVSTFAWSFCYY